jgi:hypothetical protein
MAVLVVCAFNNVEIRPTNQMLVQPVLRSQAR